MSYKNYGDATDTIKGVATFDETDFLVTAGDVTLATRTRNRLDVNFGFAENLSWSLSTGVLTVAGFDGTALSATNPAYITLKSNATVGEIVTIEITANVTLTEGDMIGATFGTTGGIAWADDMPLFIGVCADSSDANLIFFASRLPHIHALPVTSTQIGDPAAPTQASLETSVFSFGNITEANYASSKTCILGMLFATKDASEDWTITSAVGNFVGVGEFGDGSSFMMPLAQNGAATGTFLTANGGTAPIFSVNEYRYYINRYGFLLNEVRMSGDGGTDGSGAVVSTLALPYNVSAFGGLNAKPIGSMLCNSVTGGSHTCTTYARDSTAPNNCQFTENGTLGSVVNSDFSNGIRFIWGHLNYYIDNGGN